MYRLYRLINKLLLAKSMEEPGSLSDLALNVGISLKETFACCKSKEASAKTGDVVLVDTRSPLQLEAEIHHVSELCKAKALHSYIATAKDELSFNVGDIIG